MFIVREQSLKYGRTRLGNARKQTDKASNVHVFLFTHFVYSRYTIKCAKLKE